MFQHRESGDHLGATPKQEEMMAGRGTGGWRGWGTRRQDAEASTGMAYRSRCCKSQASSSRGAPSRCTVGVAALLLLLSWGVRGGVGMPRGPPPPPQLQDPASVPASDEWGISEMAELLANVEPEERERKLANLFELVHQLRLQQQQEEAVAAAIESEVTGNARMAVPPPLLHSASGVRTHPGHKAAGAAAAAGGGGEEETNGDDDGKGKRGSFMSLCHFKICNMGRKRNMRYNTWVRV